MTGLLRVTIAAKFAVFGGVDDVAVPEANTVTTTAALDVPGTGVRTSNRTLLTPPGPCAVAVVCSVTPVNAPVPGLVTATSGAVTGLHVTVTGSQRLLASHGGLQTDATQDPLTQVNPLWHAGKHAPCGITQSFCWGSHCAPGVQSASVRHSPAYV
jgi:hypothetical protein